MHIILRTMNISQYIVCPHCKGIGRIYYSAKTTHAIPEFKCKVCNDDSYSYPYNTRGLVLECRAHRSNKL